MNYKLIFTGYYVLWITCLLSEYESRLSSALLKRGYTISAANTDGVIALGSKENPSFLLSFRLYSGKEGLTPQLVHKDVMDIIIQEKMYVYSTVVSEMADCSWHGSNIILPAKLPPAPVVNPENKKLN
jgi:hypothetical protein